VSIANIQTSALPSSAIVTVSGSQVVIDSTTPSTVTFVVPPGTTVNNPVVLTGCSFTAIGNALSLSYTTVILTPATLTLVGSVSCSLFCGFFVFFLVGLVLISDSIWCIYICNICLCYCKLMNALVFVLCGCFLFYFFLSLLPYYITHTPTNPTLISLTLSLSLSLLHKSTITQYTITTTKQNAYGSVNLTSNNGGQRVQFKGVGFSTNSSEVSVFFGSSGITFDTSPQYECVVVFSNTTFVECTVSKGQGKSLVFKMFVGARVSDQSLDTLTYAPPTITDGTIRLFNGVGASFITVSVCVCVCVLYI